MKEKKQSKDMLKRNLPTGNKNAKSRSGGGLTNLVQGIGTIDPNGVAYWTGYGYSPVADGAVTINRAFIEQAGNGWDVNMQQSIALDTAANDTFYTLNFKARAGGGGGNVDNLVITAGIGNNDQDNQNFQNSSRRIVMDDFGGTPGQWTEFVLHLDTTEPSYDWTLDGVDQRVYFDMGESVGVVDIKDVSLTIGFNGSATVLQSDGGNSGSGSGGFDMSGTFGNTEVTDDGLYFPSYAQDWGGFANLNTDMYPIIIPDDGSSWAITFECVSAPTEAVDLYFKLESNPYSDSDPTGTMPSYTTVTKSVDSIGSYTIELPQTLAVGNNEGGAIGQFNSFLVYLTTRDVAVNISNIQIGLSSNGPGGPNTEKQIELRSEFSQQQIDLATYDGATSHSLNIYAKSLGEYRIDSMDFTVDFPTSYFNVESAALENSIFSVNQINDISDSNGDGMSDSVRFNGTSLPEMGEGSGVGSAETLVASIDFSLQNLSSGQALNVPQIIPNVYQTVLSKEISGANREIKSLNELGENVVEINDSAAITVIEVDNTPPIISVAGYLYGESLSLEAGEDLTLPDPTASEDVVWAKTVKLGDTVLTSLDEFSWTTAALNAYTITYVATDEAGNSTEFHLFVNVQDTIPPEITLNGNQGVTITGGEAYTDPGATAFDAYDGVLTDSIVTTVTFYSTAAPDTPVVSALSDMATAVEPGRYMITYNVSDEAGNEAVEVTRTVLVDDYAIVLEELGGGLHLYTERVIGYATPIRSNLVRAGDTLTCNTTIQNMGLGAINLSELSLGGGRFSVKSVAFAISGSLAAGEVVEVNVQIEVPNLVGSVIDLSPGLFTILDGDNTLLSSKQGSKNLITFQGDLSYNGMVGNKDYAYLNAGAGFSEVTGDVDTNHDESINTADLDVITNEFGSSLHTGDHSNAFSLQQDITLEELESQTTSDGGTFTWNDTSFAEQNALENEGNYVGPILA